MQVKDKANNNNLLQLSSGLRSRSGSSGPPERSKPACATAAAVLRPASQLRADSEGRSAPTARLRVLCKKR